MVSARPAEPFLDVRADDLLFLRDQSQDLLGDDVPGQGGRYDRLDVAALPEQQQGGRGPERFVARGQEQGVHEGRSVPPFCVTCE